VRWFDLDDIGPEVTEHRGRGWSGDEAGNWTTATSAASSST